LVSDVFAGTDIASALNDLTAKTLDLVSGHAAEIIVERIAGFELLAVDEQRVRARERIASRFVEIAEQLAESGATGDVGCTLWRCISSTRKKTALYGRS
jgi:hypothetical protein